MTIYKIKMLKSKHGLDISEEETSIIDVHRERGFYIGKIHFKPYVAERWVEKGDAVYVKPHKRVNPNG